MNSQYHQVIVCLLYSILGISISSAQARGMEFLLCTSVPESSWIQDEGIRLPVNNLINAEFPLGTPLTGFVRDRFENGIENVFVSLERQGQVFPTYQTGLDGRYDYSDISPGDPITIRPQKNDNHKNGVTTLDMVKIQKHLLGKEVFTSPLQYIAADANNSATVSAIDLVEIRKLILGVYTEFPSNQSWRFVRKDFMVIDSMNPWPGVDISTITITDIENPGNTDFIGIKIGDINGSAQPRLTDVKPRESIVPFKLLTDQLEYKNGDVIKVPIRISSTQVLTGFQFTLSAEGMEILDVLPGRITIAEGDFALFGDKMSISWFDENDVDLSADDVLFTLVLKAKQDGNSSQYLSINSDITDAEIYLDGEQTFLPVLNIVNPISGNGLEIVSCAPNPWKDETTVFFYLPETSSVTYNVVDVNGKKIFTDEEYLSEGYHSYNLKASDFSVHGMLFLEINSGGNSVVQKLVVLK